MSFAARARRSLAAAIVLAILVTGLSVTTASAAVGPYTRAELLKIINEERKSGHEPKLKLNSSLSARAQAWAKKLAVSKSDDVAAPNVAIPPNSLGDEVELGATQCEGKRMWLSQYEFLSIGASFCLKDHYWRNFRDRGATHVGFGVYLKAKTYHVVAVYADYSEGIAKTLTSAKPSIKGAVRVGSTVTAKTGTWKPTSSRNQFTYEWAVAGEWVSDEPTFVIRPQDKGKKLTLIVTGLRDGYWVPGGARSITSKPVAAGVLSAKNPVITGSRNVHETLVATVAEWGPEGVELSYQWLRAGKAIAGETETSYTLTPADLGKAIDVRVTGRLAAYATASRSTATKSTIAAQLLEVTPVPVVTGDAIFGETLSVDPGVWLPEGVSFAIQWRINGVAVKKATGITFSVPSAAVGKTITAAVTGSKADFASRTIVSAPTEVVVPLEFATSTQPVIAGTPAVGKKLSASVSPWEPVATTTYQWLRNGAKITGATKSTYVLTAASRGTTVTVAVTGKRAGYATTTVHSAPVVVE